MDTASRDDRSDEMRLYLVVRDDIAHGRDGLARLAARATWAGVQAAQALHTQRLQAYDAAVHPKIAVRVRSEAQLRRILTDAEAANLPAVMVDSAPGVPGAVCVGPAARSELPAFMSKQRLLADEERPEATPGATDAEIADGSLVLVLLGRTDAGIPWGKLAAQAGHAALSSVTLSSLWSDRPRPDDWSAAGMPVIYAEVPDLQSFDIAYRACKGIPCARIVDAGRTVFGGVETPTVIGIGPTLVSKLPDEVTKWLPVVPSPASDPTPGRR